MKTILNEKEFDFKTLEKEIFRVVCLIAVELTRTILECKDQEIFESADKKMYKSEGLRKTGIKTQYGTVEYKRRVYKIKDGGNRSKCLQIQNVAKNKNILIKSIKRHDVIF